MAAGHEPSPFMRGRVMQRGSILSPVVLSSLLAATAGCSAGERPATPPSGATALLGLGDSLTYGAHSLTDVSLPTTGYVDDFDNMLVPPPPITNYGCPGETSASFLGLTAPCPFQGMHPLHTRFSGTQVSAATTFLAGAPNAAVLLSVGGNDARAFLQGCGSPNPDPACVSSQLPSAVAAYGANLSMILDALEAQSASAPIIVINLYNPFRTGTAADVQTDGFIG